LKGAKAFITSFFIVTVSFSLVRVSTQASVGVKVDQWAKYNITAEWRSKSPNASMPTYWNDLKNSKWETVTVQKISGTNITILVTTDFINKTQKNSLYWGDIATNQGSMEFGFQIIPVGLSVGDTVRQSRLSINYTETKEFAGQNREVNYAGLIIQGEGETRYEFKWDKETGILCASVTLDTFPDSQGYWTNTLLEKKLIETNIWQAQTSSPQTWEQWAPPLVIATLVLITFILITRRSKAKRRRRK